MWNILKVSVYDVCMCTLFGGIQVVMKTFSLYRKWYTLYRWRCIMRTGLIASVFDGVSRVWWSGVAVVTPRMIYDPGGDDFERSSSRMRPSVDAVKDAVGILSC